jgi:hypothetical protein
MTVSRVQTKTPITDHLWAIGFTIKPKADRLPVEIADGNGNTFKTNFEITAYPERGEARRLFAAKGACKSEVKSNVSFEMFLAEQEDGRSDLKDVYTEQCAKHLFEMLKGEAPTISKPAGGSVTS